MSETFGARIKRLREAKGWTAKELVEHADHYVNTEDIYKVETYDKAGLPMFGFAKVASALGVTLDYLATGVEPASWADTPGKRIRLRRDELGWSVSKLSLVAQFRIESLMELEADHSEWDVTGIASVLGVTPEWILTGAEPKFPPPKKEPDAEWFIGFKGKGMWHEENEGKVDKDSEIVKIVAVVKPDYGWRVVELIRTGKMPEGM